jgi:pimeloyl-ACP methyl ester carboxylesterase
LRMLADPEQPDRLNPALGGYRYVSDQDLLSRWDPEIPPGHTAQRREARVLAEVVRAEIQADSECPVKGAFRVPNGTLHDLLEVFSGRALYAPEKLRMPCLLVRGSDDLTSTAQDTDTLLQRLATTNKNKITLPDAGHFMQAERCAAELQNLICDYLNC